MEKIFRKHPVQLPFNCPFCKTDLNLGIGPDMRHCSHVQFIRMTGESFDYFVYVDNVFGRKYLAGLKASDRYRLYRAEKNSAEIDEKTAEAFLTGESVPLSEMASCVPYFEEIAFDAAPPDAIACIEKRPYGSICFCVGAESVNTPGR